MLRGINCEVTPRRGHDTAGPQWGAGGPGASALSWGAGGDRSRSPRSCPSRREVSGCLWLLPLSGEGVGWLARTEDTEGVGDPPPLSPRQHPGSQGVRAGVVQLLRFSGSRAHWATLSGGAGALSPASGRSLRKATEARRRRWGAPPSFWEAFLHVAPHPASANAHAPRQPAGLPALAWGAVSVRADRPREQPAAGRGPARPGCWGQSLRQAP